MGMMNVLSNSNSMLRFFLLVLSVLSVRSNDDDEGAVTCGSVIKIQSIESGYYLNSEEKTLGGNGSGQQLVTFQKDRATQNTLWLVRPAHHGMEDKSEYPDVASCGLAEPIMCNTPIRLTHLDTKRNLHSHGVKSPMSRQQEVSAYGVGDGKGDGGDDWIIRCIAPNSKYWKRGESFHLFHRDTAKFLGTTKTVEFTRDNCGQNCPIMGHLEAFGRGTNDKYTTFKVEQGVHIAK
eukprot:CAMPEP_0198143206 /NCGR_PEP_ID=MMETSP1443-20131203/6031_1 /TAXON_ID=186043 /ORGANISM="Entomoneis sp., Strain CCMP2396" /LENGTH=234 /DNA_ID=CAMNT_0043806393 /DNA_START=20 /DNA_END=724 /DNA_ORIENTATION=-